MSNDDSKKNLLEREAAFWDRQEEAIGDLYARPHDWRFAPEVADPIVKPKMRFMESLFDKYGSNVKSLFDIGCGNGWFCHYGARSGVRSYGVDLAPKKVDTARAVAKAEKLDHLCTFYAQDAMTVELPEKVDLLTAHGALHHFPDLERQLPEMIDRFLKPGGFMLFIEPHHEGMSPGWMKFLLKLANTRWFGSRFDKDFYLEVSGKKEAPADRPSSSPEGFNLRGESPAGLEFLGEEPDMGEILKSRYRLLEERYFLYFLGHCSNAFYIYMKSPFLKRCYKATLPVWITLDNFLCRFRRFNRWAEEGAWFMKAD